MRAFERRQNATRYVLGFLVRSAAALALFVIMLFSVRGAWDMYHRFSDAALEAKEAEARLAGVVERKNEVASAVESFSSERGIEAQVRERYGLGKPGEGKIEIIRNTPAEPAAPAEAGGNVFMRILRALFVW